MLHEILNQTRAIAWQIGNETVPASRMPLLMGIVNVTPDSFFDGGTHNTPDAAYEHAVTLLQQGADILDIGGESSRPGSTPVGEQEELDRVCPVVEALAQLANISEDLDNPGNRKFYISVDTVKSRVAEECMRLGAHIVNDISACSMDSRMAEVVAKTGASVVLNHMRGTFGNMQNDFKPFVNVVDEVREELLASAQKLLDAGVPAQKICIDPGIGFGKKVEDNIELIKSVEKFLDCCYPILVGTSRKSYIGKMPGLEQSDRLIPTVTAGILSVLGGASVLRVHDVKEAKESLLYLEALKSYGTV